MSRTTAFPGASGFARQVLLLMALVPLAILPPHAIALPQDGQVAAGQVTSTYGAGSLTLQQTGQAAIMNWQDFSIGAGETVTINQTANAALLNRVTGANPSELLGQLNADGRVYLINPNGVVVGADANINVQEFIASTQDVGDAEFLDFANGDSDTLIFEGDSTASITNAGTITAADGDVILVGYKVANSGAIHADNGVAGLAAGKKVWFRPQSAQHILIESYVSDDGADAADGTGVDNSGNISAIQAELKAAAANVYALAINQTGVIAATGVENRNGRILLTTNEGTVAHASGSLTARNADGSGGEVLVGGDYHGLDPSSDDNGIYLAASTTFGAGAIIDVSASAADANGGRAVVWANEATVSAGTIHAQGGASGGDGGYVVVAGHEELDHTGSVEVSATAGEAGTLVLGLPTATITDAASHDTANGVIANAALATQLASANVTIDAFGNEAEDEAGDIAVDADLSWSSTNRLTLKAGESVAFNAGSNLSAPNATVELQVAPVSTDDTVTADATATLTASSLVIGQNADSEYIGFNPEPEQFRTLGNVIIDGVLTVDTLDLKIENAGIGPSELALDNDAISIANPANDIGTLTSSVNNTAGGATINGRVHLVDGGGDLTVAGDFSGLAAGEAPDYSAEFGPDWPPMIPVTNTTTLTTAGTLTLAPGARLASAGDDTDVVLSAGGGFVNQAGANAVTTGTGGRFLIYSDDPANLVADGLIGAPVYDKTFAANAPASITQTGNRFLYRLAPTLTFTANNLSRHYGTDNPALTFTVTGLVGGDAAGAAYTGTPALSTTALASDDVGTAAIAITAGTVTATDYDYKIAFAPGTLTIDPAPLTITADNKSRTQGSPNPELTATFDGLVNGDLPSDIAGLVLATTADTDSPPDDYVITASGAANPNYEIAFVNGILTVNGVPTLIITADSFDIRYGDPLPTFTSKITGFVGEDDESIVSGLTLTSTATAGSPVGTYAIVPHNATAAGYETNYVNGTLKIDPALLTITANSFHRTYGSTTPDLGVTYSGFVNDEDESVVSGLTIETSATASSNVGDYPITVADATAPNYEITFVPGTLTIDRAPLTINVDNPSKVYGDLNPTLTATANGLVLGQSLTDPGMFALTTTATQFTDVGDVAITVTATGAGADNYDATINPGKLTITPRPVTVRVGSDTREYGEANPTLTVGLFGTEPAGTSNFFNNNVTVGTVTTAATPSSDVGSYATSVTDMTAANPNFAITVEEGTLTVTPAPLTVRADNASRLYGAANPTFTGTATGLKLTDTLADVLDGSSFTTAATVTSDVGTYAITAGGSLLTDNYTVSFIPGTLTVNKAPLLIVPALASRYYGDADPDFTLNATGLLNGDTVDVVTQEQFSGSPPTAGVGSQTITILGATAKNYDLTFGAGTLNILPRPITITADDATREYGEANPAFTFSIDNLASFDTSAAIPDIAVGTVATATSSVVPGGYALNVTSGANPNYDISYSSGRLTITPAPLLVNLSDITREYGETTPTPAATVLSGLKNGDTPGMLGLTFDQLAPPTADVGTFAYGATASNPNYDLVITGGTQTITPAPLTVQVADVFRSYGDDNPDHYTVNLDGLKFSADADLVAVGNAADFTSNVGVYPFSVQLLTDNYTLEGVSGALTVTPRLLDVVASATRFYGDANPEASAFTLTGDFVNGDQPADVVEFFSYGSPVAFSADVGDYDISSTARYLASDPNYVIRSFTGTLSVTPRPLNIAIADIERFYGDANPAFTLLGDPNLVPALDSRDEVLRFIAPDERAVPGNYSVEVELINPNYTFGQRGFGRVTILPRPLSITVNNAARYYGDPNPTFTATYGGRGLPSWVNPDDLLSFHTVEPTDVRTNTGYYLISASSDALDSSRYSVFDFTPGILSILPRPITLAVKDLTFAYPTGTDLAGITDFSGVPFTATATNMVNGDTVAAEFPGLVFEVLTADTTGEVAAAPQPATHTPPTVAAMVAGDGTGSGGSDGGTTSTFIPVVVEGISAPAMETSIPLTPSTITLPAEIKLAPPALATGPRVEATLGRTAAVTGGYLNASRNYAVTAVNTGVLTMKSLSVSADELSRLDLDENGLPKNEPEPLVVRGLSEYQDNLGLLFAAHPATTKTMVMDYFTSLIESGEFADDPLLVAIFGEGVEGIGDINAGAIGEWLSDIDTNPDKRILLSAPLSSYVASLQTRDPSTYSLGDQQLIETLNAELREQRAVFAAEIDAKKAAWEQAGNRPTGNQLSDLWDGDVPYATFLSDYITDSTEEMMGKIATVAVGSGSGAAAAAGVATAAVFAAKVIFPFVRGTAGLRAAMGPVGAIIMVVEGSIDRALVIADNAKAKRAYDRLTDPEAMPAFSNLNLAPDDSSPEATIDRVLLLNSITSMLGGE